MMKQVKNSMKEKGSKSKSGQVIDGVNVEDLKRYFKSKKLLIGKMIRYLYDINRPVSFQEFKIGIQYKQSDTKFHNNIATGRGTGCMYGKLWNYENEMIVLTDNMRKIISDAQNS